MEKGGEERPDGVGFHVYLPPELESGSYANFLVVWHTAYEFTLDFCSTQPPQPQNAEDPESPALVPCRVVSRVKIPPTLIFNVLQALNDNMTQYESKFGEIKRPEPQEDA
jgi:Protein of unknown function (DUF3467)